MGHPDGDGDPRRDSHLLDVAVQVALEPDREAVVGSGPEAVTRGRSPVLAEVSAQKRVHQLENCDMGNHAARQHGDSRQLKRRRRLGTVGRPERRDGSEKLFIVPSDSGPYCWLKKGNVFQVGGWEAFRTQKRGALSVRGVAGCDADVELPANTSVHKQDGERDGLARRDAS